MTAHDIIKRARDMIAAGGITSTHGAFCPWCAIGDAKGKLEAEEGVSWIDSFLGSGDALLLEAKWSLGNVQHDPLDRAQSLALLDLAIANMDHSLRNGHHNR